jgi:hypothetical protein
MDKEPEEDDQGFQGCNPKFQDTSKTINVMLLWEIMSVEPAAPRPLHWLEVPISFSHKDQWTSFSEPGKFPLVLDPMVAEVRLTKVLIDGGSGLNLIFASTLRKMGLDFTDMLAPSKSPFYDIVLGNEFIKFEVANFESSYHAILGRPALAKFMAVPHYGYLLLKMPGQSGVLTL